MKLNWVVQTIVDSWCAYEGEYEQGKKALYCVNIGAYTWDPHGNPVDNCSVMIDGVAVTCKDQRTLIEICNRHYEARG